MYFRFYTYVAINYTIFPSCLDRNIIMRFFVYSNGINKVYCFWESEMINKRIFLRGYACETDKQTDRQRLTDTDRQTDVLVFAVSLIIIIIPILRVTYLHNFTKTSGQYPVNSISLNRKNTCPYLVSLQYLKLNPEVQWLQKLHW